MEKNLIVFVHGLGADNKDWWGSTKDNLKFDADLCDDFEFEFFNYTTDKARIEKKWFSDDKVLAKLDDLGGQLYTKLQRVLNVNNYSCVKLFGHSMGGLVISSAVNKFNESDKDNFKKIKNIVFCGTPFGGSKFAETSRLIFNLGASQHTRNIHFDSKEVKDITSRFVNNIEYDFNDKKPRFEFMKLTEDQVVTEDEERYGILIDHVNDKKINLIYMTESHSGAVQDLDKTKDNFDAIKTWITDKPKEIEENTVEIKKLKKTDVKKAIDEKKFSLKGTKTPIAYDDSKIYEARLEVLKYREYLSQKNNNDLDEFEQTILKKNFIIVKRDGITTILKNGSVIISAELTVEIIKSGNFISEYQISTSFPENVKFDNFKNFLGQIRRFSEYSFDAEILSYTRGGKELDLSKCPKLETPYTNDGLDKDDEKEIVLKVSHCREGDVFVLAHSITIPKEYVQENIELMKKDPKKYQSAFRMRTPIAYKKIVFQEERYAGGLKYDFRPALYNNNSEVAFNYECEHESFNVDKEGFIYADVETSLFYRKHSWQLYFQDVKDKELVFKLV